MQSVKRFGAFTLGGLVTSTFLTERNAKGSSVWVNCRRKNMVMPGLVKRSNHEITEISVSKASRDKLE
jgi:hypothetical protein